MNSVINLENRLIKKERQRKFELKMQKNQFYAVIYDFWALIQS